jgi:hypothetical protein
MSSPGRFEDTRMFGVVMTSETCSELVPRAVVDWSELLGPGPVWVDVVVVDERVTTDKVAVERMCPNFIATAFGDQRRSHWAHSLILLLNTQKLTHKASLIKRLFPTDITPERTRGGSRRPSEHPWTI